MRGLTIDETGVCYGSAQPVVVICFRFMIHVLLCKNKVSSQRVFGVDLSDQLMMVVGLSGSACFCAARDESANRFCKLVLTVVFHTHGWNTLGTHLANRETWFLMR